MSYSAIASIMDNGYFRCDTWWENTDTQAVMSIGIMTGTQTGDREILKLAIDVAKEG